MPGSHFYYFTLPPTPLLQFVHRWDVSLTRSAEGKSGKVFVGDMSEEKAVQLASKVVSEGFVYGVSLIFR